MFAITFDVSPLCHASAEHFQQCAEFPRPCLFDVVLYCTRHQVGFIAKLDLFAIDGSVVVVQVAQRDAAGLNGEGWTLLAQLLEFVAVA